MSTTPTPRAKNVASCGTRAPDYNGLAAGELRQGAEGAETHGGSALNIAGNFEMLAATWPEAARFAATADAQATASPVNAARDLRVFAEKLVRGLYRRWGLPTPAPAPNLYDLMSAPLFARKLPQAVIGKLHGIRSLGNKAAHGDEVEAADVDGALRHAHDVARLVLVLVDGRDAGELPSYDPALRDAPPPLVTTPAAPLSPTTPPAPEQVEAAARAVDLDEAATRVELIDVLLAEAGWRAPDVAAEVRAGTGFADYVLWDEHRRPLAVIEAKATSRDPLQGAEQAKEYADALERAHGLRPVIFLTNGYELWIWDDAQAEPMRRVWGFYGRRSLHALHARRAEAQPLHGQPIPEAVRGRTYQQEAVVRVAERFDAKRRRALLVQATGTGKTRVAVAVTEMLLKAGQARRVLFLCDRRELRKQARDAFAQLLPAEPLRVVEGGLPLDPPERVFLATYPGMMDSFRRFDPGFFDLVICDESHRSLYNVYRELIEWFDARVIGLTATPVAALARNTFDLFGCEDGRPTFNYPLEEAIADRWLVPYEVWEHSTRFSREGLREDVLTPAQVKALEEGGVDPATLDYGSDELDRAVFNLDTNRQVLRNLMENGVRDADGTMVGKSIVFARSKPHAELLMKLFLEMYPQYGADTARVIHSEVERVDALIDRFKNPFDPLRVAISVDMLDTGLDVPEILNLVFARPVRSHVKFQQMIGRGTRLRPDLFGPGRHKTAFRVFDHWGNFERFGLAAPATLESAPVPLLQRLFAKRVELARSAKDAGHTAAHALAVRLILADLAELDERTVAVRAKLREKRQAEDRALLDRLSKEDVALLVEDAATLMGWRTLSDPDAARFDLQVAAVQAARVAGRRVDELEGGVREVVAALPATLAQVQAEASLIAAVGKPSWWETVTVADLEDARLRLRPLMRLADGGTKAKPRTYDVREDESQIRLERRAAGVTAVDMRAYEAEVNAALHGLFDTDPALRRLRAGAGIDQADIERLVGLVLVQNPAVDVGTLRQFFPEAGALHAFFRQAVGVDVDALRERFAAFGATHAGLTGTQRRFLQLLESHIARVGAIALTDLYEPPFAGLHAAGFDDLFPDTQGDDVAALIRPFAPAPNPKDLPR